MVLILDGQLLNDSMGIFVANQVINQMITKRHKILRSKVLKLGITLKEICPDIQCLQIIDVTSELQDFGACFDAYDPFADLV